jgi:hypothetical protein
LTLQASGILPSAFRAGEVALAHILVRSTTHHPQTIGWWAERLPVQPPYERTSLSGGSLEVGGVEPPSPGAYRKRLQVYPAYRVVGAGAASRRAFPSVSRD